MNRPLIPGFLKRFDRWLLLNKPDIWSARIHLLVFYSLLFCGFIALFCFFSFNDVKERSEAEVPTLFICLLCFIGLVTWLIYLLRFNVFKRFGEYKTGDGIRTFLLFFTGMFFIVLPAYVPLVIESWKANMAYTSKEMLSDINRMNELIVLKHRNILPQQWNTENILLVPEQDPRVLATPLPSQTYIPEEVVTDTVVSSDELYATIVNKEQLADKLANADSSFKLSDSTWHVLHCPDLTFVYAYAFINYRGQSPVNSIELYRKLVRGQISPGSMGVDVELNSLLSKYRIAHYPYDFYNSSVEYKDIIDRQYRLGNVNYAIGNIAEKKYRWATDELEILLRVIFYAAFSLALLLFILRHSTVRVFFLSVLTFIVLMILNGIFISIASREESTLFGLMLFNYAVLFALMLFLSRDTTRKKRTGIALNIVTVFTAFVPLVSVMYYYSIRRLHDNYYEPEYYDLQWKHIYIAEIGGVILFLVLAEPFFKKMFRKWYARPEN